MGTFRSLPGRLLGLWCVGALLFIWLVPPFFAPDETIHAAWAARFFTGIDPHQTDSCSKIEASILNFPYEDTYRKGVSVQIDRTIPEVDQNLPAAECKSKIYASSWYAFPVFYGPFILGLQIFKDLSQSLYFARVIQFLVILLSLIFLVSHCSQNQGAQFILTFFLTLYLLPMSFQQSLSLAMDFWFYLGGIYFAALILSEKLTRPKIILCVLFIAIAGFTKPVIAPLLLLIFIWGGFFFADNKNINFLKFSSLIGLCLIGLRGSHYLSLMGSGAFDDPARPISGQMEFVLSHPFKSFWIILTSILKKPLQYPGTRLGWLSFEQLTANIILAHVPLIIFLKHIYKSQIKTKVDGDNPISQIPIFKFLISIAIVLASNFLVGFSLYLAYSSPGLHFVHGLQSRYFFWSLLAGVFLFGFYCIYKKSPKLSAMLLGPTEKKLIFLSLALNFAIFYFRIFQTYP